MKNANARRFGLYMVTRPSAAFETFESVFYAAAVFAIVFSVALATLKGVA